MYYLAYSNIQQLVTAAGLNFPRKHLIFFFFRQQTNFFLVLNNLYSVKFRHALSPATTVICCCTLKAHHSLMYYLAYSNIQQNAFFCVFKNFFY